MLARRVSLSSVNEDSKTAPAFSPSICPSDLLSQARLACGGLATHPMLVACFSCVEKKERILYPITGKLAGLNKLPASVSEESIEFPFLDALK